MKKSGPASPRGGGALFAKVALGLTLMLAGGDRVGAQTPPPAGASQASPVENEALELYKQNKLITARKKAEEALDADPDSVIGHFVLGSVLREAEGSLGRAMFHLGRAREILETRWGSQPPIGQPMQLHREILYATQALAGEMEEYGFQLQILDYHDALYDPDLLAEHAWAVLRLGRFDDARNFARRALAADDAWQKSLGKNALCAIEAEARQREPQFKACVEALNDARRRSEIALATAGGSNGEPTSGSVTVHAYNAAQSAYSVMRHDEVEKLALEGTRRRELTIANPWRLLTRLYTDGGRIAEALGAAAEMQGWRARLPANLRDQDGAETDLALSTLLLVVGEAESGLRLVARAMDRPDRRGLVSSKPEQALGATALLRRSLDRTQRERRAEVASVSGTIARVKHVAVAAVAGVRSLPDDQRLAEILGDETRLDSTFRIYLNGGIEPVPVWLLGDLIDVLGPGVVSVVLQRVRREEVGSPQLAPYYDALEAEIALAQGTLRRAQRLAMSALAALPKGEALLAARTAAVGAEAARRDGDLALAMTLFERALEKDPGAIRRLGLAIPASVRGDGDPASRRAVELLRRSPRLRDERQGFLVAVEKAGPNLKACLRSPQGASLSCAEVAPADKEASDDFAARLADEFQKNAFAVRVGLTAVDIHSLDGSTTVADQAQRERVQGVLNDLAKE